MYVGNLNEYVALIHQMYVCSYVYLYATKMMMQHGLTTTGSQSGSQVTWN